MPKIGMPMLREILVDVQECLKEGNNGVALCGGIIALCIVLPLEIIAYPLRKLLSIACTIALRKLG